MKQLVCSMVACAVLFPAIAQAQEPTVPSAPGEPPPEPPAPAAPQAPEIPPTPAPALESTEAANPDTSALAKDGHPMSGWHNGLFYLRDYNDNFRLYVQGRAQVDAYSYAGKGVSDVASLKPTVFLRRIRPEFAVQIFKNWFFAFGGDFGANALDNANGRTTETSAAGPGVAPTATTGRYASAQSTRISAAPTDVFVNYRQSEGLFNAQFGQYDAPFTMENRTSDKYVPFMERSLTVRNVAVPTNKEIGLMLWGETTDKLFFYSAGLFNGDGQNRLNTDSRGDAMGRVFVHPLATAMTNELKDMQIGGSVRYGSRDQKSSNYDYNTMTTQGNWAFWSPVYNGANGFTHVIPSGDQMGFAGELRIPISMFDLTSEFVYIKNNTREALEGFQATNSERFGEMKGYSYYVQLGFWPIGKRDINGMPGYENMPIVDFKKPDAANPPHALQILAKWEQLNLTYSSASRSGTPDAKNIDGDIRVNALTLGANFWLTKHLRFSANYVLNMFPDSAPTSATAAGAATQTRDQRAIAPGNTLAAKVNDSARDSAHELHEILFRVGLAL